MKYILYQNFLNIIHMVLMVYIMIRSYKLISNGRKLMLAVYFTFGTVSLFMEDLYWIAYDFLRPETRMPVAANEIAEDAAFLLLSAVLANVVQGRLKDAAQELIGTVLFAMASIGLWIAWSGEWIQDIVGGIAFGYLMCRVVFSMKLSDALSVNEWRLLGLGVFIVTAGEIILFYVPESVKMILDLAMYGLMFIIAVLLVAKTAAEFKGKCRTQALLSLSFACFVWSLCSMYMSEKYYYIVFYLVSMVSHPLMLRALEKEVEKE